MRDDGEIPMPTWPTTQAYPGVVEPDVVPSFDCEIPPPESGDEPRLALKSRYSEVARLHAIGKTNRYIAEKLGYSANRISIILRDPYIQSEIARYRRLIFEGDVVAVYKEAALDGARLTHQVILDPKEKTADRLSASRFAHEAAHGKAKQQVSVDHGGIVYFTELLKEMRAKGEILDVTPIATPALPEATPTNAVPSDEISDWLDSHLSKP